MSIQPILEVMDKLCRLHQSLFSISKEKTELLKKGDITSLQKLLVQEKKHIQALGQMESQREMLVANWLKEQGKLVDQPTVTDILECLADGEEKEQLSDFFNQLLLLLVDLKKQEQLNKDLLQQSLQFVELSLNMLEPSISNMNYGKNKTVSASSSKRSVFDSKA